MKLRQRGVQLFNEHKYVEALATQRSVAIGTERIETARDGKPGQQTAESLSDVAWYALFVRAPGEALRAAERAHKLSPKWLPAETNRAHALLFLRRTNDARKLYLAHKGRPILPNSDETWEDVIAKDFDALRAAGIAHMAFPRIVAALGVKHPELNAEIEATRKKVDRLYSAGQYRQATGEAETLVDFTRRRFGDGRTEFATAITWLALSKQRLGLTAEAEPLYKRSLAIWETALGREHPNVAAALNDLAGLYSAQSRYGEAEPLYKRSLAICETALGREHPNVATALNNLAELYRAQSRYGEAESLHKRSLAIRETALGREHPDVAQSLNNLAELYRAQGRYGKAEP